MIEAQLQQEIVVRSENRAGVLASMTRILSEMGINILAVRLYSTDTDTVVHVLTNSQSYAADALQGAGFEVAERDVILLELPHHPGFLRRASEALARKEIVIHDLHISVPLEGKVGIVVLTTSNNAHAIQLLRSH
jgi:hypothetical protein